MQLRLRSYRRRRAARRRSRKVCSAVLSFLSAGPRAHSHVLRKHSCEGSGCHSELNVELAGMCDLLIIHSRVLNGDYTKKEAQTRPLIAQAASFLPNNSWLWEPSTVNNITAKMTDTRTNIKGRDEKLWNLHQLDKFRSLFPEVI